MKKPKSYTEYLALSLKQKDKLWKQEHAKKCKHSSKGERCHNPGNVCPEGTDDHHNAQEN